MTGPAGVGGVAPIDPGVARARPRPTAAAFQVATGGEAAADAVCGTETVTSSFLLALQENQGDATSDEAAHVRLREVLAELGRLQRDLLRGGIARTTLARLAHAAQALPAPADPALRHLLAQGVLRIRVELARYDLPAPHGGDLPAPVRGDAFAPRGGQ